MRPFEWVQNELGVKEIPGAVDEPRIEWYHTFTTLKATNDETPWCSSLMCAAAECCGYVSTKSAAAISWKNYGIEGDGSVGDIAVFKRDGGNHVTFVALKHEPGKDLIYCLGGNQNNKVGYKYYHAADLICFRRFP